LVFKNGKLNDVKYGNILLIPKTKFNTRVLSGINHNSITLKLDQLYYKEPNGNTVFPKRYHNLIHKK